ncbi:glutathione S-transferase family protein [Mesorhizobium sp. LHD-90]|uniref:glutathione S-transferase family protein n=1 Tax=Mesorhizobium sp. LHD-90 TaxID=3071414 RepID=UPI0027E03D44|nr:glutathione S-transferase family protein [Mesorhizobium sp. LHD-90]MDQ6433092.1 glutathione S-transferase family protein [Mesorhizobium sp. LHD-90]
MGQPVVYGADYSVYVRIVRLALHEKRVDYELIPVDVFAEGGPPVWYFDHHPFGRIPAFEHDGLRLYETTAITRYIDEAFGGPALQPADARDRAVMNQIVALIDAYAYRPLVWDIAVETVDRPKEGIATDPAVVEAAMPKASLALSELTRLKRQGDWLLGENLSLADLHAAPIVGYFLKAPLAGPMIGAHSSLVEWWRKISRRDSFLATEPAD